MPERNPFGQVIEAALNAGAAKGRKNLLDAGIPIFYVDSETGLDVMEQPGGRKFEIRYIPGAPRDRNYEILRELERSAA
jgi:hypothetical protein